MESSLNPRINAQVTRTLANLLTPAGALAAVATKGADRLWIYQGDRAVIGIAAGFSWKGEKDLFAIDRYHRVKALQERGFSWDYRKHSRMGGVWLLVRNGEAVTTDGYLSVLDPIFAIPDTEGLKNYIGWDRICFMYATVAPVITKWLSTLEATVMDDTGAFTRKLRSTWMQDWIDINRDESGIYLNLPERIRFSHGVMASQDVPQHYVMGSQKLHTGLLHHVVAFAEMFPAGSEPNFALSYNAAILAANRYKAGISIHDAIAVAPSIDVSDLEKAP